MRLSLFLSRISFGRSCQKIIDKIGNWEERYKGRRLSIGGEFETFFTVIMISSYDAIVLIQVLTNR